MATESGDMRSLGSLLGWEADDPGDNVILSRLTRLISAHLPDGWQEWRVHTYSKEDLLGNELDSSTRAYRDIKLKLLEWPLCVGLIIGPASLAARIRGSAVQNELVVAALADIKPLLICREEANRELSADTEDNGSVTHSSRRSNSSVRVSKRQDRLSRLEENHMVLKEMLESFMKKFETPFDSQENSACESTDEDSASAYSSENNGPPVTEKSSTQATSAWKPPEPPLGSDDDFDWQPCTKPQDPVIPNPKPHIAEQGVKVLRLGDTTYNQIRYVEVQKRLHAAPVFGTLKANPVLVKHITPNPVQDQLGKMDYVLGTVVHGLLMQRDALHGALKDLSNKHPGLKEDLKSHLSTGSAMKTISDDLLQFACGRRNEIIEQRRNLLIPKDEYQASLLNSVPPSTTHLFCETKLAEAKCRKRKQSTNSEVVTPIKRDKVRGVQRNPFPHQLEDVPLRDMLQESIKVPEVRHFRGGRLRSFLEVWKSTGAPKSILNIIEGYTIPFVAKPPLIPFYTHILRKFETKEMTQEIISLIDQGILEHTSVQSGFLSTMFPVPKSDGKIRPIINLRGLNRYLLPRKFRLLNHFKVPHFLQQGDYLVKIDISQAYFHVPIKTQHRRFLSIVHQGRVLQFTCLPFGLSTAPLTFARLSNWVVSRLQDMGIRVVVYLDDFLLACQNPIKLREDAIKAVNFLTKLGWIINTEKSLNEPLQQIEYLGIVWNTLQNATSLPQKKILSIEKDLNKILRDQEWNWQLAKSLLGKLNFASFVIPLGRLHCRNLQRAANLLPEHQKKKMIPITPIILQECAWWLGNLKQNGSLIKYRVTVFITSDASDQGWGAQIDETMISGLWTPAQKQWHINKKELYAVLQAFRSETTYLKEKRVVVQSDNRTVVAYIKKQGGTRSRHLTALVSQLLHLTQTLRVDLCPQYIPGICNDIADSLSRQKSFADWHLSERVTNLIFLKWGTPEIDLFATRQSRVVPAYVSRDVKDKEAQFTDAFSRVWQFNLAWIFPPPSLIPRVLAHLNQARGTYIIIVPRWEKVFWRSDLKARAMSAPFQIRNLNHHLQDMTTHASLPNAQNLRLEAWRIRGGRL
ncbi:hypothetical protein MSG28_007454 [Choristoneura fumiferana]|uniref:Uncharacterized protein n=1 Tax=Choristoneura fumiferana TaxID=7141 RepID=A0ACC0JXW1_CHOFU|nr:hypothetical protein MSG28_007454 [Choristoneura fumiferana]